MNTSDEDDDDTSPIILTYSNYDSEEDYCSEHPNAKMDKPLWERYWKQIEESEGFDITDCPGGCWMLTIYPMSNYLSSTKNVDKLKGYAGKALELYNSSNVYHFLYLANLLFFFS
ncbi:uncharacterized protein LOC129894317 [Solanum dulcamara]|uniref:uncharacterized protein LOC129894317 n=1 Tax=Solanum dulcamara TaxID=45834 RepID=UPI0024868DBF|nr:uncharacterized protein LOC129894317 [Solanum dulcamara]